MPSEKHFLYHLIISQLYHDGFGPHATLLEEAALNTNRAIAPSDRLKQMLSVCAHTVREVDDYFEPKSKTENTDKDQKFQCFSPMDRLPRPCNTPSPYHTLARRRLTAAKRHSLLSLNRGKHMKSSPRTFFTNTYPKTSNIPITTSPTSDPPSSKDSTDLLQTLFAQNNPDSGMFVQNASDSGIFSCQSEKAKSAETVRVLQNIFQKRDMLPSVPVIGGLQSDMSQDLTSLIQASTIGSSPPPSSQHSPPAGGISQTNHSSPEHMNERPVSAEINLSAFSPTSQPLRKSPDPEGMVFESDVSTALDMSTEQPITATKTSQHSSPSKPLSPTDQGLSRDSLDDEERLIGELCVKEESLDATDEDGSIKDSMCYPPASQDIINQLNSLSASGIGNIQNLANSLTNSFCDPALQDNQLSNLSSLSLNLPESLASSLNLSVAGVTGSSDHTSPSSRASSSQLSQSYGGMSSSKLEFLNRLEGTDSPSMLSMVSSHSRGAGVPSSQGKRFKCPHCNKCYASYDCLSRHKRIHTGANKKTCPTCFRLFFRADHFKTHLSTCTKKMGSPTYSALASGPSKSSEAGSYAALENTYSGAAGLDSLDVQYRSSPHLLWASQFIDNIQSRAASRMSLLQQQNMNMPRITGVAGYNVPRDP